MNSTTMKSCSSNDSFVRVWKANLDAYPKLSYSQIDSLITSGGESRSSTKKKNYNNPSHDGLFDSVLDVREVVTQKKTEIKPTMRRGETAQEQANKAKLEASIAKSQMEQREAQERAKARKEEKRLEREAIKAEAIRKEAENKEAERLYLQREEKRENKRMKGDNTVFITRKDVNTKKLPETDATKAWEEASPYTGYATTYRSNPDWKYEDLPEPYYLSPETYKGLVESRIKQVTPKKAILVTAPRTPVKAKVVVTPTTPTTPTTAVTKKKKKTFIKVSTPSLNRYGEEEADVDTYDYDA